jgi:MOSC domain-containing protein YiiM
MPARVERIYYKDKDLKEMYVKEVHLLEGFGIEGDLYGGRPQRHISLLSQLNREKINSSEIKGLCSDRFKENITFSGEIDLKINSILKIGDVKIKITETGKRCFEDCKLHREKLPCFLKGAAFGEVLSSGTIKIGDTIEKLS